MSKTDSRASLERFAIAAIATTNLPQPPTLIVLKIGPLGRSPRQARIDGSGFQTNLNTRSNPR